MIEIDVTQVLRLQSDLSKVAGKVKREVKPIVARAAGNIQRDLAAMMGTSSSFGVAAGSINFDMTYDGGVSAEIGPDKASTAGALGNIAYFGTSRGGGTVEDPERALRREEPALIEWLGKYAEGLL